MSRYLLVTAILFIVSCGRSPSVSHPFDFTLELESAVYFEPVLLREEYLSGHADIRSLNSLLVVGREPDILVGRSLRGFRHSWGNELASHYRNGGHSFDTRWSGRPNDLRRSLILYDKWLNPTVIVMYDTISGIYCLLGGFLLTSNGVVIDRRDIVIGQNRSQLIESNFSSPIDGRSFMDSNPIGFIGKLVAIGDIGKTIIEIDESVDWDNFE